MIRQQGRLQRGRRMMGNYKAVKETEITDELLDSYIDECRQELGEEDDAQEILNWINNQSN